MWTRAHIKTNSHSRSLRSTTLYTCSQQTGRKRTHVHHLEAIEAILSLRCPGTDCAIVCCKAATRSCLQGVTCVFRCHARSGGGKERLLCWAKGGLLWGKHVLKCGSRRCDCACGPNRKHVSSSASDERRRSWLIALVHLVLQILW